MNNNGGPIPETNIVIKGESYSYPFSRGILAHTLIDMGIEYSTAYRLAQKIWRTIIRRSNGDSPVITELEYTKYIEEIAEQELNDSQAQQVKTILEWKKNGEPIIILLSGAEGSGGTALGKELSDRFSISQLVSTSYVANILKKIIAPELAPELHSKTYKAHEKLRPINSVLYDEILIGFVENARYVTAAVEAIVTRALKEGISLIIRGEHIVPRYFSKEILESENVIIAVVSISDKQKHLQRLLHSSMYGLEDDIILNFQSIRKIHDYLVTTAKEMGFKVIDNSGDISEGFEILAKMILERLPHLTSKKS